MSKREEIESHKGESRYIRRDEKGRFTTGTPSQLRSATEGCYVTTSDKSGRAAGVHNHSNGVKSDNSELSVDEKLMNLRQKIVDSGRPLLTWDEINEEVARRRGGVE